MKEKMKQYKTEIILTIAIILITAVIFGISKYFNLENIDSLKTMSELIFSSLIGLVAIWISGYFILIQLYKNTYPMEIIEKNFLKIVKIILICSFINILIGVLVLTIFTNYVSEIYYLILFVINVGIIFYYTYRINRIFTINTYVDNYFKELGNNLEKENIKKDEVDKVFKDFHKFFDECIVKDEYYVCNNISKKIGLLFEKLIEHCNAMILKNKEEMAEYIFDKIVNSGLYQISYAKDCQSKSLVSNIFRQQEQNIKICIKIGRIEWFKKYVEKINLLIKKCQENDEIILDELYDLNMEIGEKLLDKDDIWIEWFVDELYKLNVSLKYAFKNIDLKYFGKLLTYIMVKNVEKENYDKNKYNILKNIFEKFTYKITHINDSVQDVVIYYSLYGNQIIENQYKELVKDFIEIITSEKNRIIEDEKWNEFVLYYLNITMQEWQEDFGEFNRKIIINLVLELSIINQNCNYYSFLPEYDKIIKEKKDDPNLMNQICDEFDELFTRLIINNNVNMFYLILRRLKNSIILLEQKDKKAQEKLFNLYIGILIRTVNIENKKFAELTLSIIDDTIDELDKNRKISNGLGIYIIEEISDVAIYRSRIKEMNVINVTNLLADFLEEEKNYNFIVSDNTRKKLLYKNIYNIGMSCIENNMENALRNVSNRMGWLIIGSLNNSDSPDLTNYLIDRTIDLFKIAKNMEISEKTIVFIMTLFTTVGTFCCKDPKYIGYLNKILGVLKNDEYGRIKTAIELRTRENNMWDKLFEGNTQQLTQKFLKELRDR
ncbi:MAG TPA: hypothetical protein DEP51_04455 [Clostridiales bacterium]|nr:hypothetical protein [Clostridiales bacterium]